MRYTLKIFILALAFVYIVLLTLSYLLIPLSLIVFFLLSIFYVILAITGYKKLRYKYEQECYSKCTSFLSYNYAEVTPIHPIILAAKCHILFDKNIKVYAKFYFGYIINVKIISGTNAYKIESNNWIWFYENFKEKEP